MSLDFDLSNIENYKEVCEKDGVYTPLTQTLVFGCMGVGLGSINEKNFVEFCSRLLTWQHCFGPLLSTEDGPYEITPEDIWKFVGLRTNVQDISSSAFKTKVFRNLMDEKSNQAKQFLLTRSTIKDVSNSAFKDSLKAGV